MEAEIQRTPCRCAHYLWCNVGRVCPPTVVFHTLLILFRYDEGTAFMSTVPKASQLPVNPDFTFLTLDVDGYDLPSDWYMRIAGYAAEGFHRERALMETFPVKELQDYWSSRPHSVDNNAKEQDDRYIEVTGQAYKEWEEVEAGGEAYSIEELVEQTQASHGQPLRPTACQNVTAPAPNCASIRGISTPPTYTTDPINETALTLLFRGRSDAYAFCDGVVYIHFDHIYARSRNGRRRMVQT